MTGEGGGTMSTAGMAWVMSDTEAGTRIADAYGQGKW